MTGLARRDWRDGKGGVTVPRALLVEDEANIVLAVRMCLEEAGYAVEVAKDGVTAVQRALAHPPDVVLLDLVIPDLDGFLVCEALRADPRTERVPIVILSARAQSEDIERALGLGADDYLVKPFRPAELLRRVGSCLAPADGAGRKEGFADGQQGADR